MDFIILEISQNILFILVNLRSQLVQAQRTKFEFRIQVSKFGTLNTRISIKIIILLHKRKNSVFSVSCNLKNRDSGRTEFILFIFVNEFNKQPVGDKLLHGDRTIVKVRKQIYEIYLANRLHYSLQQILYQTIPFYLKFPYSKRQKK